MFLLLFIQVVAFIVVYTECQPHTMLFLQSHSFIASHTARVRANELGCDIILMYANCAKITPTKSQAIIHQRVSPMCAAIL